jgi:hypothetical protein
MTAFNENSLSQTLETRKKVMRHIKQQQLRKQDLEASLRPWLKTSKLWPEMTIDRRNILD